MKQNIVDVRCASCKHLTSNKDHRGWVHYTCPYAKNIEWLGGFCREPLNSCCGKYELKSKELKLC